jgi:hypothetical protein
MDKPVRAVLNATLNRMALLHKSCLKQSLKSAPSTGDLERKSTYEKKLGQYAAFNSALRHIGLGYDFYGPKSQAQLLKCQAFRTAASRSR